MDPDRALGRAALAGVVGVVLIAVGIGIVRNAMTTWDAPTSQMAAGWILGGFGGMLIQGAVVVFILIGKGLDREPASR